MYKIEVITVNPPFRIPSVFTTPPIVRSFNYAEIRKGIKIIEVIETEEISGLNTLVEFIRTRGGAASYRLL